MELLETQATASAVVKTNQNLFIFVFSILSLFLLDFAVKLIPIRICFLTLRGSGGIGYASGSFFASLGLGERVSSIFSGFFSEKGHLLAERVRPAQSPVFICRLRVDWRNPGFCGTSF